MDFKRPHHIDDIDHARTPAEDSLHESYLLKKTSNIGSLYSSNIYQGQCFEKTIKQLEKSKKVQMAGIDREMKIVEKRMNDLKVRSPSSRLIKSRSETIGYEKELHWNNKSAFLELPSLGPGERTERMRARLLCRTMSDISLHTGKDHRKSTRPRNFPSTPAINIMTCNSDTDGGTSTEDDKRNNNEYNMASKNEENPVVFSTTKDTSFFISDSPVNSPRLSHRSMKITADAPPQRSPSPCILAPVDKKQVCFAQPPSPRLRRPYASRSYDDIVSSNDNASVADINIMRLQRRPRAHTISGHMITRPRYEDREGSKDDQSESLVLPKI